MKGNRQEKILEIIENEIILTQDDLQNALFKAGYSVTQSTVSRDIKALRLIKGHDLEGNYRYVASRSVSKNEQNNVQYRDLISGSVISVENASNDVVVKCYTGMAQSVCVALDVLFAKKMLGSIAGDDTIFIITHTEAEARTLCDEIKKMM